jgi:hypothetical protein
MTKLPRFFRYPFGASVLAVGLVAGASLAAPAAQADATHHTGSASGPSSPAEQAAAIARAAIKNLMIGQHATDQHAGHALKVNGQTDTTSTNWAGYADTGSNFSKVSANWTEPSGSCGSSLVSMAAFWVGIDGFNSSSVEQDGTMIECYLGTKYEYTWWEMYPTNSVQTVGSTVAAGDKISASVTRSGTSYALKVTDSTHPANTFSTTQTGSGDANSSAEWVAEAPSSTFGVEPLANFGTWNATGDAVTSGSKSGTISSFPDDKITMADSAGLTQALPSALNSGGNAFSVTWKSSS